MSGAVTVEGIPKASMPFDFVTIGHASKSDQPATVLSVEVWHQASTAPPPRTESLPADGTYNDCELCVVLDENFDDTLGYGDPRYFARAGTITITEAGSSPASGMLQVSGSNVELVEWDLAADGPTADGKCYQIGTFSLSGSY
jgi:hypothetical protein